MDTALELKIGIENGLIVSSEKGRLLLETSQLFSELLTDFEETSIHLLHRLIELSEIPFTQESEKVKKWRDKLAELTFCEVGFSLSGDSEDILACYNAMIASVLIKLDYQNYYRIERAIEWILKYQSVRRNETTEWKGKGILKYGGCMKSTPCFIGVVKSMIALSGYKRKNKLVNEAVIEKLNDGLEYILEHDGYRRKSTNEPITKDITKLTFPFTYKTNLVEILRLLKFNNVIDDPRVDEAKELLKRKKKGNYWKSNAFYKPKFWIDFDKSKQKSEWLTFEIENTLHKKGYDVQTS